LDKLGSLQAGELTIDPQQSDPSQPIDLFWRGRSTDRHPARVVVPYVSTILGAAKGQDVAVRLHFETIEHMNSSTITALIQIIQEARARATRLTIVYDRSKTWQKLSFDALGVFVKDDGIIVLDGEP
jgi:hypothetical protein